MPEPLLAIRGLSVEFRSRGGTVRAVEDVAFAVEPGEMVGVVGESGSGKSVTALATMGILPTAARLTAGSIRFNGVELTDNRRRRPRGLAIIFQNPRAALNPIRPVGKQIVDALRVYSDLSPRAAQARAIELLDQVHIREPARRFWAYPFELSGGMCQRVMIAIALATEPQLLIADEPTTGLDVTIQKAIVDLLVELAAIRNMATLLITHDLALAGERCRRLIVMQKGRVVEAGSTEDVLLHPTHAYVRSLVAAAVTRHAKGSAEPSAEPASQKPLLEVEALRCHFRLRRGGGVFGRIKAAAADRVASRKSNVIHAVDGVDLQIMPGESVGLVGESGSGKSTLVSLVVRLINPTSGRILFNGEEIGHVPARRFANRPERRDIQMVFQDPTGSLNPRQRASDAIAEPLRLLGDTAEPIKAQVEQLADLVGLPQRLLNRLPHQLSGGEKARVGIARAIALRPRLLVLDEPTAALDAQVQAVVLDLLAELRQSLGMSYLFVSHDLTVVRELCGRVLVMQGGRIVDSGTTEQLLSAPDHPYTRSLIEAVPRPLAAAEKTHTPTIQSPAACAAATSV